MGWLFDVEQTPQRQYAPDLLKDRDIVRVSRAVPVLVALVSLLAAAVARRADHLVVAGRADRVLLGLSLVRVGAAAPRHLVDQLDLPRVRRAAVREPRQVGNVWWLAILSMGESWHNLHHADPTCARHGVLRGQLDSRRRVIRCFEKLGWVYDVRWPTPGAARRATRGRDTLIEAGDGVTAPPCRQADRKRRPRMRMTGKERREQLLDIGRVAVRREGLRRHLGRGDRGQGRRLQAGRLRALRRQGGPVRRRRRPRDAARCSTRSPAP